MSKINDGGPAFPGGDGELAGNPTYYAPGMTLRDYFAAKAMAAIVNSYRTSTTFNEPDSIRPETETQQRTNTVPFDDLLDDSGDGFAEIARQSYAMADAMLAAREAKAEGGAA